MMHTKITRRMLCAALLVSSVVVASTPAMAQTLEGTLTDALTGYPIEGGTVRVAGTERVVTTDAQGTWSFELPDGAYQLIFEASLEGEQLRTTLVNQRVPQYKPANAHLYTTWFKDQGVPEALHPTGTPTTSGQLPADAPDSIALPTPSPLALTVTDPIPRRIRVGRRQRPEEGCRNNPIIAIEEMDIDDYVKGVLPPEIGIFRSIPGALETYKAFGIAAKSYGLWFMLTYDENNRRDVDAPLPPDNHTWFHIDDTACNQRYTDERLTLTTQAAEAIANKILVKKGEPGTLDKLEYAASCGKHGTLPEYGTKDNLVPDTPPVNACAGSWCGHNTCAGHEDNPNLAGSDRCLVRGMCQWGTASWGESGQDYLWILSHYQPNLELRDLQQDDQPMTVTVQGYVYTNQDDIPGSAIGGANVSLSNGMQTTTSAQGVFAFEGIDVSLANVTVTAMADGYTSNTRTKPLVAGEINWASVQLMRIGSDQEDMGGGRDDMGSPQDMGGVTAPDMSFPTPVDMSSQRDQGSTPIQPEQPDDADEFDDVLTVSTGLDGGCTQSGSSQSPSGGMAGLLMLCGLGWFVRRRKRS